MKAYQVFLTFHPHLKPHFFKPSEDNPTEYLLVLKENGAALGISLQEKRLIHLLEGQYQIRDIIQKIVEEQIAPLSLFRKLLWDLDRYGYLEESPWPGKHEIDDWGYWGFNTSSCTPFTCPSFLGRVEEWFGGILCSPAFCYFTLFFLCVVLFYENKLFLQVPPFLLNHSAATGFLVVLLSVMGFLPAQFVYDGACSAKYLSRTGPLPDRLPVWHSLGLFGWTAFEGFALEPGLLRVVIAGYGAFAFFRNSASSVRNARRNPEGMVISLCTFLLDCGVYSYQPMGFFHLYA